MYVVEEEGVEAIPLRWLTENGKECYWPQFKNIHKNNFVNQSSNCPDKRLEKVSRQSTQKI